MALEAVDGALSAMIRFSLMNDLEARFFTLVSSPHLLLRVGAGGTNIGSEQKCHESR